MIFRLKTKNNTQALVRPQRESEAFRWGVTEYEDIVEDAFRKIKIWVKRDQVICFICHGTWTLLSKEFPSECWNCGTQYGGEPGKYMLPDILIEDPKCVIYVNGDSHDKKNVKLRDKLQKSLLKLMGYKVHTIENEELDLLRQANRRTWAAGVYATLKNQELYDLVYAGEKEIV